MELLATIEEEHDLVTNEYLEDKLAELERVLSEKGVD